MKFNSVIVVVILGPRCLGPRYQIRAATFEPGRDPLFWPNNSELYNELSFLGELKKVPFPLPSLNLGSVQMPHDSLKYKLLSILLTPDYQYGPDY